MESPHVFLWCVFYLGKTMVDTLLFLIVFVCGIFV